MTINVYWACLENEWLRDKEPESVSKHFYDTKNICESDNSLLMLNKCPSFNKNLHNLYQIRSLYSYNFKIENNFVSSEMYDQKFFDDHISIRSIEKKAFSFSQRRIFYTDLDSLEMSTYQFPYLENNNITKRTIPISGTFDIGKWFRNIEYPFYLKDEYNDFVIEENEIMFYLKFHTTEKIRFIQFYATDKIKELNNSCINSSQNSNYRHGINFFYNIFKTKKIIEKEIKLNILN